LPTGAIVGMGARVLIGSQIGESLVLCLAVIAATILAGGLIVVVGWVERVAKRRMGAPA